MTRVAVCIVAYRNAEDVTRCLAALARSGHAAFDVVICENGGPEAYRALAAVLPERLAGGQAVRAVQAAGNLGYAGGVNVCLAASPDADAWWVLNPDTQPDPEAMGALVRRLEAGDCDAAGGVLVLPDGAVQSYGGRWRAWAARAESIGHGRAADAPVDAAAVERAQSYLSGASMMIGRRFLQAVGPMREEYFLYCEEVEWCLRALARGMRLGFAPEARVRHEVGTTTGSADAMRARPRLPVYLNHRNQILVTRDCFPRLLPVAAVGALGVIALRYARRGAWRQCGYALAGWTAGLRDRRGAPAWA